MRRQRYGFIATSTTTTGKAAAATAPMCQGRAPARYASAIVRMMRARLLPRSGWITVSPAISPAIISRGKSPCEKLLTTSCRRVRNDAR